ncbi:MAG: AsmA-like C-terminal region-containing protein [Gammaproteobacteria bacterium]|nr:AsmA-like C-terminal region-containing protein [Gammaproteobacteria bacterium]MBU1603154.1 AsmA-like C-terminal region-containing protein [Gammaproteobacteria bacterium]MBU2432674.1 AsmA-like C-terminal region-containing protein [Gammaproteobacteria bacterium]MBU2451505.1 AsmA-like C-terminal region-containing protein [Gammaproteobacteria bacterium]
MDSNLVYAKTPTGDEAVRQSTRVVQRNLRMVLVQVDGKMSVEELTAKIGNPRLVLSALRELEAGGYIAPSVDAESMRDERSKAEKQLATPEPAPPMSQFSTFGPKSLGAPESRRGQSAASNFSSFGKPILPSPSIIATETAVIGDKREPELQPNRQGTSAGRKLLLGISALLATFVVVAIFYPYEQFKPALEASATRMLKTPVKIDLVGIALFPSPALKLTGIHLGESGDGDIAEIRIFSPHTLLGDAPYQIAKIEISRARLPANSLLAMPMFMGDVGGNQEVVARKLVIEHLQLTLGDSLAIDDLFGDITVGQDGGIEKATFESVDRSVLVNAQPNSQGLGLNIEGRAWSPAGGLISFASLQAKGVLQKDKLLIQNIDTTFLGGILRGNWLLDWSNGLSMAGDGTYSRLDSRKVSAAFAPSLMLEGDMSGSLRLRSSGRDWEGLWSNLEAVLVMEITRGAFHGVDLGEAVRRGGVSEVRGGLTKFDRLRSTVNISPGRVVGREIKMDAGTVTAAGQFNSARNGEVEANMSVTMQTSVSSQNASVRVFGTLPDLNATTRK